MLDRLVAYGVTGAKVCDLPAFGVPLEPHQQRTIPVGELRETYGCGPESPGRLRIVLQWRHVQEGWHGALRNPLDAYAEFAHYGLATDALLARFARECKPVQLPRDPCAGVTCATRMICGQPAPCEVCVDGSCVTNEPHFDSSCTPSCGVAASLCGQPLQCGATGTQCQPAWDCPTCCVPQ